MRLTLSLLNIILIGVLLSRPAFAQSVEVDDGDTRPERQAPSSDTGKGRANEYFKNRKSVHRGPVEKPSEDAVGERPHFLAVHFGTFFADNTYRWSNNDERNVGRFNGGVTYRIGEWEHSMDFSMRAEYSSYSLDTGNAGQIAISPVITFPDANSRFPLYFGVGAGPGLFVVQVPSRSPIAINYQVFGGVRFLDVVEHIGFMVEAGLKNHVLLGSPGQFNGVFINIGSVFAF